MSENDRQSAAISRDDVEINHRPRHTGLENGFTIEGYAYFAFQFPEEVGHEAMFALAKYIVEWDDRYKYGTWGDAGDGPRSLKVFDTVERCVFQLLPESDSLVLSVDPSTNEKAVRAFWTRLEGVTAEEFTVYNDEGEL